MPMSDDFEKRLNEKLPEIVNHFGTPFHILDEKGVRETCREIADAFSEINGYRNFFAVKACPRLEVLRILKDMGMGFDCSSVPELGMAREIGAGPDDIMFTSNNTSAFEYEEAMKYGGCVLNLDDISFVEKVPVMPELVCFRYNPGRKRDGTNVIIGNPVEQKYGVPHEKIVDAYRLAMNRGAKRFGLHTMIASNTLEEDYIAETAKMLLDVAYMLMTELGIQLEFINIGGGVGIPYKPGVDKFDLHDLGDKIRRLLNLFMVKLGYAPRIISEMGRYVTGPHGVLVTRCINKMEKYHVFVGVDACMSANPRPAIYSTPESECYHHITVAGVKSGEVEEVNVVGSLCENNDQFAKGRSLPVIKEGAPLFIQDTGAHALAMGSQYNARLLPQELMFCEDGSVKLIKEAEMYEDYLRTQRRAEENPQILTF